MYLVPPVYQLSSWRPSPLSTFLELNLVALEPLPPLELTAESNPCFLDPVAGNIHEVGVQEYNKYKGSGKL